MNNFIKRILNKNITLKCNVNKDNNPITIEVNKHDIGDIYAVVRKIYLMGDTIKKRNKSLWRSSASIIEKTEPYLINKKMNE